MNALYSFWDLFNAQKWFWANSLYTAVSRNLDQSNSIPYTETLKGINTVPN